MYKNKTSREEHAQHVANMRTNFALEDLHPQAEDLHLQQSYIDGKIKLADMLKHAHQFALAARKLGDLGQR